MNSRFWMLQTSAPSRVTSSRSGVQSMMIVCHFDGSAGWRKIFCRFVVPKWMYELKTERLFAIAPVL